MGILEDLWYGSINPCESRMERSFRIKNVLMLLSKNENELKANLSDQQKEQLERLQDSQEELTDLLECSAFAEGFCLAVKIMGKLKSVTSKRDVPLNDTAIKMIEALRKEYYFGEDTPLVTDGNGNFTRPVNFRNRYYRILKAAGIETKGLHSLRHTFATNLVNGIKQADGTIKALSPRQVADLLRHSTLLITEMHYVKRDMERLSGVTDDFNF